MTIADEFNYHPNHCISEEPDLTWRVTTRIRSTRRLAWIGWFKAPASAFQEMGTGPDRWATTATGGGKTKAGWWFGTFFVFPYIWNNHPNWLIFFRGVQTTNQVSAVVDFGIEICDLKVHIAGLKCFASLFHAVLFANQTQRQQKRLIFRSFHVYGPQPWQEGKVSRHDWVWILKPKEGR